ncbi:PREDICTED: uncharacterized protein LOC106784934 isoform X2 [Polistes canadensis]|uniref:uncharacterized protein LOC106784934 isoform X2 n=1 Tax=Polistes canadensis TaxID=91411 RepID=UPI000718B7AA|nr:PREDICTED: uncharacterized protein LOC106784934 isoform X2 [Polistes canadensis]
MSNKNISDGESSSSEDEIIKKALEEAADISFLKSNLFDAQITKDSENKERLNNTSAKSLRKDLEKKDNFCNFGVTLTFKAFVAKQLDALLERTVQWDSKTNSKTTIQDNNKDKLNKNNGIKLLNSSTILLTAEDEEAAVNPEWILSKVETKFWTERHKGSVFKYKKSKNGN